MKRLSQMRPLWWLLVRLAAVVLITLGSTDRCHAEVTPEQTQELRELKKEVAKVASLLRKKQFDDAQTLLDEAEQQLSAIVEAADVLETSRRLLGLPQLIAKRRKALDLQRQRAGGVPAKPGGKKEGKQGTSFSADVAPIVVEHCLECHGGANPRAGLNLTNFTGWKRGGVGGPLLVPGAPLKSLLIARLRATDPQHRMPRGRDPLPVENLNTIATWINAGAKFDGASEDTALSDLAKPRPKVEIPLPKGSETVSFSRDIAPFMVQLCVNCHSGNDPRGGLSLTTFENMMVGGDSGAVILPGKREQSRLFRLTGGLENPRMPQSNGRLTRENYENLVKWFDEGNVFDGDDPRALLTSYASSTEDLAAERFTKMSAEEITAHRQVRTKELWKQSLPSAEHQTLETDQFVLVGDVSEERLSKVREWADEHITSLQRMFGDTPSTESTPVWRGKLGVLVFNERFGLTEYFLSVRSVQQSERLYGESVVTPSSSDAYIVLLDTGDVSTNSTPSLRTNLRDHLTTAFVLTGMQGSGGSQENPLVTRGVGLYVTALEEPTDPYLRALPSAAASRLRTVGTSVELFADGTFAPADTGPVGYAMIQFFAKQTSRELLVKYVQAYRQSQNAEDAMSSVAGSDLETFGKTFLNAIKSSR